LNGVSVSKSAKIGERPYPSQFHPVEIPQFSPQKVSKTPQSVPKFIKNPHHQVFETPLQR